MGDKWAHTRTMYEKRGAGGRRNQAGRLSSAQTRPTAQAMFRMDTRDRQTSAQSTACISLARMASMIALAIAIVVSESEMTITSRIFYQHAAAPRQRRFSHRRYSPSDVQCSSFGGRRRWESRDLAVQRERVVIVIFLHEFLPRLTE